MKNIYFFISVLTVSFGLGLDLDSNFFGLGLDSDSNFFGLGLDSVVLDLDLEKYVYLKHPIALELQINVSI